MTFFSLLKNVKNVLEIKRKVLIGYAAARQLVYVFFVKIDHKT